MDGILLVDKPRGWTSHDVVAKVRGILRQTQKEEQSVLNKQAVRKIRVGHTGTLDPLATGLLVLVVGNYTKRAQEFSKLDKTYEVTMKLGETSTTGDAEGIITPFPRTVLGNNPTEMDIEKVLSEFQGEIEQVPPAYSAIKVNGTRAYKLARQGKKVEIEPRIIKIYTIVDLFIKYPEVKFTAKVSSGTYIRSLVEDIGKKLGAGAYMSDLRRTAVGRYSIYDAITFYNLSAHTTLPKTIAQQIRL